MGVLLATYGNEAKYGSVCSDIREIVTVLPFNVCVSFAILHAVLRFVLRWFDRDTGLREEQKRLEFSISHTICPFMSTSKCYWIYILTKLLCDMAIPAILVYVFRQ